MPFELIIAVVGLWALYRCAQPSERIHDELRKLKQRAGDAEGIDELEDTQVALQVFAAEHCWHKAHAKHAKEILNYIRERIRDER